jgi:flagellar protein FliO/FliZ
MKRFLYLFFPILGFALDTALPSPDAPSPLETEPIPPPVPSYEATFWKMLLALAGMVIFLLIVIWLFKRFFSSRSISNNQSRAIKIIERRPLSPKSMLYLVEIGKNQVLICESQHEVRRLMTLEAFEEE